MTRATTENRKNFKVFIQFGTEIDHLPDVPEATADPNVEGVDNVAMIMDLAARDVDKVAYFFVDIILNDSNVLGLNFIHVGLREGYIQGTVTVESTETLHNRGRQHSELNEEEASGPQ